LIESDNFLILISSTLIICYISGLFYTKTKIPDIIWVLGFGILLGPVLGFFDKEIFLAISPLMSVVALSIILFDAGINVNIMMVMKTMVKSTMLSVSTFLAVVVSIGYFLVYLMPTSFTLLQAMLVGSMIGGTSTIAVLGILDGMKKLIPNIESARVILMMESVISDPICIIASITIIKMIMFPGVSLREGFQEIIFTFIMSSAIGFAIGLVWAEILDKLRGRPLNYMMTIAILFPAYLLAETLAGEGGGAMAALTFGMAITNYGYIVKRLGFKRSLTIDKRRLREFHEEITFLIKAFFFVYIGLIVSLSLEYMKIGLAIVAIILIIRYAVATSVGSLLKFSKEEKMLSRFIFAQGLPAFIMSQLPFIFDPERICFLDPEIYPNLCMPIVLGTVIFAAIAGPIIAKWQLT
jgi:cell volume regulation protein A